MLEKLFLQNQLFQIQTQQDTALMKLAMDCMTMLISWLLVMYMETTPSRAADQQEPFRIRPGRIAGPHPLPSRQFQALFDSLFKVLFIFPSRYLFAIGLSPVFSLGRSLPPDLGCIPKQPDSLTAPRGATGSGPDGALTLPGAPFQGTWARSVAEDASPDYNSDGTAARFSSWAAPGSLAVTRGILVSFFSSAYLYA